MSLIKADINWDELGFDAVETRSMFKATCSIDGQWSGGSLVPYGTIELSPAAGVLTELLFSVNDVVEVGTVIARIGGKEETPVEKSPEVVKDIPIVEEVTTVEPVVEVPSVSTSTLLNKSGRFYSPLVKSIAMRRVGKPEDISNACMYLLSDQANYITGTEMIVDGGITSKP